MGVKFICNFEVDTRLVVTNKKINLEIVSSEIRDKNGFTFPCFFDLFTDKLSEMDLTTEDKVKNEHIKLICKSIDILNKGFKVNSKNQFFLEVNNNTNIENQEKLDEKIDFSKIYTHDSIKPTYDSCCVCQEITNHLTSCVHHVCIPCLIKIKRQNKKDKCPMCRNPGICYFNEIQNIDDDDDDDEDEDEAEE